MGCHKQCMDLYQRSLHQIHGQDVINKNMGNINLVTFIILKVLAIIAFISIVIQRDIHSICKLMDLNGILLK